MTLAAPLRVLRLANGLSAVGAILGLGLTSTALAAPTPAVIAQLNSNGRSSIIPDYTVGWDFQVAQDVHVSELGFFDMLETTAGSVGDGLFEAHQVGIWTDDGTHVVSGTVGAGVQAPLENGFRYVAVPEVKLVPGTTYIIGAHYPSSCNFTTGGAGDCSVTQVPADFLNPAKFVWDSAIIPGVRRWGMGFAAPIGAGNQPAFGPTFRFTPGDAPPPGPGPPPGETVLLDPLGDFHLFAGPLPVGSPAAPDLLQLKAGFTASHLLVTVDFAPGTMHPAAEGNFYVLGLDLDLNLTTGGSFIPGADTLLPFSAGLEFATVCDGFISPGTCGQQIPVLLEGDQLRLEIPLDSTGIDDDGVVRFGFVAGLFAAGVPVSEDAAFDGVSGSLDRNLTMISGAIAEVTVPMLEPWGALLLTAGLLATAIRRLQPLRR